MSVPEQGARRDFRSGPLSGPSRFCPIQGLAHPVLEREASSSRPGTPRRPRQACPPLVKRPRHGRHLWVVESPLPSAITSGGCYKSPAFGSSSSTARWNTTITLGPRSLVRRDVRDRRHLPSMTSEVVELVFHGELRVSRLLVQIPHRPVNSHRCMEVHASHSVPVAGVRFRWCGPAHGTLAPSSERPHQDGPSVSAERGLHHPAPLFDSGSPRSKSCRRQSAATLLELALRGPRRRGGGYPIPALRRDRVADIRSREHPRP